MTQWPGFWLGPVGGMVALPGYVGQVGTKSTRGSEFYDLLGGGRVAHQRAGRALRSWSVQIDHSAFEESAPLAELLETPGDWWLVTPDARAGNVLTPGQAGRVDLLPGGQRPTAEGDVVVRSWLAGGEVRYHGPVPIVPGLPVTGSAWVQGGAQTRVAVEFLDFAGAVVGTRGTTPTAMPAGVLTRLHRVVDLASIPAGAVQARLLIDGPVAYARPAITWTSQVMPWTHGRGASNVYVDGMDTDLERAVIDPASPLRMEGLSFEVEELDDTVGVR